MKRYIKCKTAAKWEKNDANLYNLYDGNEWLAMANRDRRTGNLWEASTQSYYSIENTLAEAKKAAIKLIEKEAEARISDMQRMGYSSEEMAEECKTNPYLRYMGISL